MEITFEKWEDGKWYIQYPEYDGDQEDLEMIGNSAELLDEMTTDGLYVTLDVNLEEVKDYCRLKLISHDEIGATYEVLNFRHFTKDVWLCNVVHNLYEEHPDVIYFRVIYQSK